MRVHEVERGTPGRAAQAARSRAIPAPTAGNPHTPGASSRCAEIAARLRDQLGDEHYDRYLAQGAQLADCDGAVELVVPSSFMAERLQRRLGTTLRRLGPDGSTLAEVRVRVDRTLASPILPATPPVPAQHPAQPLRTLPRRGTAAVLRHRLREFLVGEPNRLAHSAATRIAEGLDDAAFSPLCVHGPSGVGKTHLLQGVAGRFLERRPTARARYVTAETFTNEYIHAIRSNATDTLRRNLRRLDLLCLDDVHFLGGKESTQTELLHTLDAIAAGGARVVLASDEHPRQIAALNSHLVSRFLSGAVVRIGEPDEALRRALVRELAGRRGLILTEEGLAALTARAGETPGCSVRELEGLLNQVEAVRRLTPDLCGGAGPMDGPAVRRALGLSEGVASSRAARRRPVRFDTILREVCQMLRVEAADLFGRGRHRRVVVARAVAVRLSRELTTLSYPEIAKALHRPNHSTVITADQRIGRQMEQGESVGCGPDLSDLTMSDLVARARGRVLEAAGK
ncbi:MAG: ATP-binding protein [Phycisphaerales bacterium]|nr:ATP-binding protein [Phycisphaerales bacterium]